MRIRRPIRPERNEKRGRALRSLTLEQATEASAGIGPVLVGGGPGDADHRRRILDRESREMAELDQLGGVWVFRGQQGQRLIDGQELIILRSVAAVSVVKRDPPALRARLSARLRRASSMRIRRMASAAAAKKCPRLFHS